jgi:hypothetical protein
MSATVTIAACARGGRHFEFFSRPLGALSHNNRGAFVPSYYSQEER